MHILILVLYNILYHKLYSIINLNNYFIVKSTVFINYALLLKCFYVQFD